MRGQTGALGGRRGAAGGPRGCAVCSCRGTAREVPRRSGLRTSSTRPLPGQIRHQSRSCARQQATSTAASSSAGADSRTAVVIVDHGSRRAESNRQLEQFVELYRRAHPGQPAFAAHMELAAPSILDAVRQSAEAGCSRVIVAPYFLSHGRHIQQDIPALVAEAQAACPGLECVIAEPIGLDEAVVGIIKSRVDSALAAEPAARS